MAQKMIAGGAWVQIQIMLNGVLRSIGLASGCGYDEDWNIQQAQVLGHLGPISLDSQGYSCSISISLFIPEKKLTLYADGGEITIEDILPYRDEVQEDGKGREFDQIMFVNKATQKVINSFTGAVIASNGQQCSPNAYITANMRLLAIKRDRAPAAA